MKRGPERGAFRRVVSSLAGHQTTPDVTETVRDIPFRRINLGTFRHISLPGGRLLGDVARIWACKNRQIWHVPRPCLRNTLSFEIESHRT
jgi:hypothetical protein